MRAPIQKLILVSASFAAALVFSITVSAQSPSAKQSKSPKPDQPNIVFIMSDDHAYQAISAYNKELINTPYIDQIAKEGALMNRAFVNNSLCGPSRASLLTGKFSHMNGFRDNRDKFDGSQQTLPKLLKAAGYNTAIVGKWHLNSLPQGFDYWNILPGQGNYYNPGFNNMGKDTIYSGYVTDITTDLSLAWIDKNRSANKPFFLMIHQKAPHRNQMPALRDAELFNDRKFKVPASFNDDYKDRPALQRNVIRMADDLAIDYDSKVPCDNCDTEKGKWQARPYNGEIKRLTASERKAWDLAYQKEYDEFKKISTKEELVQWQYQRFMEDYLRCIRSVDDNVGRVLKYLKDNKLDKNTIVIYTSDQGFYLGEHGLYDKRFMYNESFRTPMMIKYPAAIKPGQQINEFVMNLDIAPTLLDYANARIPADIQGESMKSLLSSKPVSGWRQNVYYHYYEKLYGLTAHYGVMNSKFKLIHFYDPVDSWELFDLEKDPQEMVNQYKNPAYASVVKDLHQQLAAIRIKYKDTQN